MTSLRHLHNVNKQIRIDQNICAPILHWISKCLAISLRLEKDTDESESSGFVGNTVVTQNSICCCIHILFIYVFMCFKSKCGHQKTCHSFLTFKAAIANIAKVISFYLMQSFKRLTDRFLNRLADQTFCTGKSSHQLTATYFYQYKIVPDDDEGVGDQRESDNLIKFCKYEFIIYKIYQRVSSIFNSE